MISNTLIKRFISSFFLFPITLIIIIDGNFAFNLFLIIILLITCNEWLSITKSYFYRVTGLIFIHFSLFTSYLIRNNNDYNGLDFFILIFLICVLTDIGGYIFGNIFKGPKLTNISPNKTFSGVVGSFLFSLSLIFLITFFDYENSFIYHELKINIFILIIFISSVSQLGDILISFFKRKANLKDTGKIIPGHGGLLDRIDGMILAFPFSYIIGFFI